MVVSVPAAGCARRRVRVGILDLVSRRPLRGYKSRVLKPNYAAIMPQIVGVWARQLGHHVEYATYTGFEDLERLRPRDVDVLFLHAFTQASYLAYSLSNQYRQEGVVTVLGGPHARAYRDDALRYFDYVCGLTDRDLVDDLLREAEPQPQGVYRTAAAQPASLPGVRERWPFIEHNLAKTPSWARVVPMLSSLGCPYHCSFCIDAGIPYQPLPVEQLCDDLDFLRQQMRHPAVGWHDPNFGVRFDEVMGAIEATVPPGAITFIAESTLSLLTEPRLRRLQANGFTTLVVGIESWFDFNDKAKQGHRSGQEKMEQVAEVARLVTRYIPHMQTNFVFGLDADAGPEPFELTRDFVDRAPATVPAYSLHTSFGRSSQIDERLQAEGRTLRVPYPLLAHAMPNTVPKNYRHEELFARMADLTRYTFLPRVALRRFRSNCRGLASRQRWYQLLRSKGVLGRGRQAHYLRLLRQMESDRELAGFFRGGARRLPEALRTRVRDDMGPYYDSLPQPVRDYLEKDWTVPARPATAFATS